MGPTWPFLLMYGSHDMRHTSFRRLTVVNVTPGKWGVTLDTSCQFLFCNNLRHHISSILVSVDLSYSE